MPLITTGKSFSTVATPIQGRKWDPVIEINREGQCNGDSIAHCSNRGFGRAYPNCKLSFVDCNTRMRPLPFITMQNVRETSFGIAGVKLNSGTCDTFCIAYGGKITVIDTEEKYQIIYIMVQKINKEKNIRGNYLTGLEQCKKISGINK
jgi:hypothetical protein